MTDTQPDSGIVWTFLPGLHGTGELFEPLWKLLPAESKREMIRLPKKGKQDYATLTKWLDESLPPLESGKRLVIAESFSGPLALALAANRKEETAGLVLGASFCAAPLNPGIGLLPLRPLFMVKPPSKALRHFLMGEDASADELSRLRKTIRGIPASTLTKRVRAVLELEESNAPDLAGIPMMFLQAQNDNLVPWDAQQKLESRYPAAQVHWIESPHLIFQRHPQPCAENITAFAREIADGN